MKSARITILGLVCLLVTSCATVYKDQDFGVYQEKHKVVAIAPFTVNTPSSSTSDESGQTDGEGQVFQQKLYSQLLKRYGKGEYTVSFQDIDRTNTLLNRAGITPSSLSTYTKAELAELLGVDSIIAGSLVRSNPQSTGAAVATALLFGYSKTNEVTIHLTIHDGESGRLLWSFDHDIGGALGSSPDSMAKSLMKQISSKFPYRKKKS